MEPGRLPDSVWSTSSGSSFTTCPSFRYTATERKQSCLSLWACREYMNYEYELVSKPMWAVENCFQLQPITCREDKKFRPIERFSPYMLYVGVAVQAPWSGPIVCILYILCCSFEGCACSAFLWLSFH